MFEWVDWSVNLWVFTDIHVNMFVFGATAPPVGHGLLIHKVSRSQDHTQLRTTVGRTPLDEWSTHRRDLYLTTHNTHNRHTSMPPGGIRTRNLSRWVVADLRLRPCGQWELTTHNTHNRHTSMPPSGIWTHNLSRRVVADLRLRPCSQWELTTHTTDTHQCPPVGFEPTVSAGEWSQTYALDRAASGNWQHTTLTTDTHPCPPVGFEPVISAGEQSQTYALDRVATGSDTHKYKVLI